MSKKIKISIVSYLNSKPFLYGLKSHEIINNIELYVDNPAECAKKVLNKEVDLGLIPVGVLPKMENYEIVSDFCIGCNGKVDTVAIFSDVPIAELETLSLDYQSRTSVLLAKYLLKKYWKISPKLLSTTVGFEDEISKKHGALVIGDRAFPLLKKHKYVYDLGEAWRAHTNKPFVFAAWVSNCKLEHSFISKFNDALKIGLKNYDIINETSVDSSIDLKKYLEKSISFDFNNEKKEALHYFLSQIKTLESEVF